jgi:uncharacterized protein with GYD domain
MSTFIMLTRLSHQALETPASLETLGRAVTERIKKECPGVDWVVNYAVLGPADYLDIFTAPDLETATKVATLVRTFGHATTEVWGALPWGEFVESIRNMASPSEWLEP